MLASLGGLIKDYRLQKNISQIEIAFAMGWSEPSRLSRIEQGRVNVPSRELLDRLIKIMKLSEEEKNVLLLAGNYLPSREEILAAKKVYSPFIEKWPYPATVFDFSWRVIDMNAPGARVYQVDDKFVGRLKNFQVNRLEILFDASFMQNKYLEGKELQGWHDFLEKLVAQYCYLQKTRTKEKWYIDFIKRMMSNDLFKELWQKIQFTDEKGIIQNYGWKNVVHPNDRSKRLLFHIFLEPMIKDPRFYIDLQVPANQETLNYFSG